MKNVKKSNYHHPDDNVLVENKLYIPKYQQKDELRVFSCVSYNKKRDLCGFRMIISKNTLRELKELARILSVNHKQKKDDLIKQITPLIVFEGKSEGWEKAWEDEEYSDEDEEEDYDIDEDEEEEEDDDFDEEEEDEEDYNYHKK